MDLEDEEASASAERLISRAHEACCWSFARFINALKDLDPYCSEQTTIQSVDNDFDRYKIWAINVGAMYHDSRYRLSLDHRLSEAPFYKSQVGFICG